MSNLLSINNLTTNFNTVDGNFNAVDGISFDLKKGESLAIVGESGSGKSVSALSILQLNPTPQSKITNGEIIFNNENWGLMLAEEQFSDTFYEKRKLKKSPIFKFTNDQIQNYINRLK